MFELGVDSKVTDTPASWRDKSARAPLVLWAAGVPLIRVMSSLSMIKTLQTQAEINDSR